MILLINKQGHRLHQNMHQELVGRLIVANLLEALLSKRNWLFNSENVINLPEAHMIFGKGYAAKRNAILYNAIKHNMDYLIFMMMMNTRWQ